MREPIRDKERLEHMLQAINYIDEGLQLHTPEQIQNYRISTKLLKKVLLGALFL